MGTVGCLYNFWGRGYGYEYLSSSVAFSNGILEHFPMDTHLFGGTLQRTLAPSADSRRHLRRRAPTVVHSCEFWRATFVPSLARRRQGPRIIIIMIIMLVIHHIYNICVYIYIYIYILYIHTCIYSNHGDRGHVHGAPELRPSSLLLLYYYITITITITITMTITVTITINIPITITITITVTVTITITKGGTRKHSGGRVNIYQLRLSVLRFI